MLRFVVIAISELKQPRFYVSVDFLETCFNHTLHQGTTSRESQYTFLPE